MTQLVSALIVTFDAYKFSTRSRKAALQYRKGGPTVFLGTSGAGRTGRWDSARSFQQDGIDVVQVKFRRPRTGPTILNQILNLLLTYVPGYLRLINHALRSDADVVHVTSAPLAVVGFAHRIRHRSHMVLDIQERPGAGVSRGSLTSLSSLFELRVLRLTHKLVSLVTVVTEADVDAVRQLGFRKVALVRNAPMSDWRAPYVDPPASKVLDVAAIGSIFEGRAYETLLHALARALKRRPITLRIYGPGRPDYVDQLQQLAQSLMVSESVQWMGVISSDSVSQAYLDSHVGLVLYEPVHTGNDSLSNKILECVASGRPVIASNLPENRYFVQTHGVGWLTDVDADSLAYALTLPQPGPNLSEISLKCRQYGDDWLNWESEFAHVLEHVASLTSKG